jgi:hypothetical protein
VIPFLQDILCAIEGLATAVVNTLILSVNGLILLLGVTLEGVLELLPDMPDPLEAPTSGVLGWINWLVPLSPLIAFCTTALLLFAAFMAVKVILTWLRAL